MGGGHILSHNSATRGTVLTAFDTVPPHLVCTTLCTEFTARKPRLTWLSDIHTRLGVVDAVRM